ncbi:MAG: transporter [Alphaproteobacteria bacterium]|nr:transporter [Alphaproteobacteria bacterium]
MPRILPVLLCFLFLAAPGVCLWPSAALADETEEAPEHGKINTPDPSVVDPGHAEFETTYVYSRSKRLWDNNGGVHERGLAREHAAAFTLTAGILENLDAAIGSSYGWLKDKENDFDADDGVMGPETGNGFGDTSINARYRFLNDQERHLEIAYIGGFTVPTGRGSDAYEVGSSQDFWSFDQTFTGTKDWSLWTANADVGYSLSFGDKSEGNNGTFNADVAAGYQVLSWLQPEMEINYARDFIESTGDLEILALTAGLVMPIHERLRINTGLQQGVWGRNADRATTFSIAAKTAF